MKRLFGNIALLIGLTASISQGGVIVIDGTDSNDHGSAGSGGWLYMRAALNNISGQLGTVSSKTLNVLDTTTGSQAQDAISWAFTNSTLPGSGWVINYVPLVNISTYLSGLSTGNTGILYISTVGNTAGDLPDSVENSLTTYASNINSYTAAGGGLFAQGESPTIAGITSYQWIQSLLPGLAVTDGGSGGFSNQTLTLTTNGNTVFPGLTNADLSTGPWHNYFGGNLGGLQILATGLNNSGAVVPVIIGTNVGGFVPEPGTTLLISAGLGLLAFLKLRRSRVLR